MIDYNHNVIDSSFSLRPFKWMQVIQVGVGRNEVGFLA
jgi:hypothetical protein